MITPSEGERGRDIVGGEVRDIKAFRMGRDAVSLSGGNNGLRVRDVSVRNVRLERGYHRGAVEVSDGSDNVTVRDVYAQDAVYAIDVQDHGKPSAPNTKVLIENVEAVRCKHIIRTANGPRGHEHLTLRNFVGKDCTLPVQISHTKHVRIEQLTILNHTDGKSPPIRLQSCEDVLLKSVTIQSQAFPDDPIRLIKCSDVRVEGPELNQSGNSNSAPIVSGDSPDLPTVERRLKTVYATAASAIVRIEYPGHCSIKTRHDVEQCRTEF
jgi:hypothetical protein